MILLLCRVMPYTYHVELNMRGLLNIKGNGRIAAAHLKQSDLLEGGQVDVHSDGSSHYQGHLVQQLGLIWE